MHLLQPLQLQPLQRLQYLKHLRPLQLLQPLSPLQPLQLQLLQLLQLQPLLQLLSNAKRNAYIGETHSWNKAVIDIVWKEGDACYKVQCACVQTRQRGIVLVRCVFCKECHVFGDNTG